MGLIVTMRVTNVLVSLASLKCNAQEDLIGRDEVKINAMQGSTFVGTTGWFYMTKKDVKTLNQLLLTQMVTFDPPNFPLSDVKGSIPSQSPPLRLELLESDEWDPEDFLGTIDLEMQSLVSAKKATCIFDKDDAEYIAELAVSKQTLAFTTSFYVGKDKQQLAAGGALPVVNSLSDLGKVVGKAKLAAIRSYGLSVIKSKETLLGLQRSPWAAIKQHPRGPQEFVSQLAALWESGYSSTGFRWIGHSRFLPWSCAGAVAALLFQLQPLHFLQFTLSLAMTKNAQAPGAFDVVIEADSGLVGAKIPSPVAYNGLVGKMGAYSAYIPFVEEGARKMDYEFDLVNWVLLGSIISWASDETPSLNPSALGSSLDPAAIRDAIHAILDVDVATHKTGATSAQELVDAVLESKHVVLALPGVLELEGAVQKDGMAFWKLPPYDVPVYELSMDLSKYVNLAMNSEDGYPIAASAIGTFNMGYVTSPWGHARAGMLVGYVRSATKVLGAASLTWQVLGQEKSFMLAHNTIDLNPTEPLSAFALSTDGRRSMH